MHPAANIHTQNIIDQVIATVTQRQIETQRIETETPRDLKRGTTISEK